MKVEEQDALGLRQLSPKLISTHVITKYGELHYSMLIRVVESCTMALIQHIPPSDDDLKAFHAYGLVLQTGLLLGMELQITNTGDPYFMILELDSNVQVSYQKLSHCIRLSGPQVKQLSNLSPYAQASIGQQLWSLMVFNYPDVDQAKHPIYNVLGLAFRERVPGDTQFTNVC